MYLLIILFHCFISIPISHDYEDDHIRSLLLNMMRKVLENVNKIPPVLKETKKIVFRLTSEILNH